MMLQNCPQLINLRETERDRERKTERERERTDAPLGTTWSLDTSGGHREQNSRLDPNKKLTKLILSTFLKDPENQSEIICK